MFSTKAEYGIRVMAHLARRNGSQPISLGSIADAEGLPLAYLEHLVQRLRKAELVESRRGAHGGYTLARPAAEITMAEVVSALEGDIAPIECITADADGVLTCAREGAEPCPTKLLWTRVQGSIVRTLNEMTLDDLVQPLRRRQNQPSHDARDPEPARPHRGPRDPPRRRPDREARRDARPDGPQRLGQVHARQHADGQPQLRGDRGPHRARRRGHHRGRPGRARPRRPVPGVPVPGHDPRRLGGQLPAHGRQRRPRGADQGQGVRRAAAQERRPAQDQRRLHQALPQRGLLGRREEARRDPPAGDAPARLRGARRDRLGARHRRPADRLRAA